MRLQETVTDKVNHIASVLDFHQYLTKIQLPQIQHTPKCMKVDQQAHVSSLDLAFELSHPIIHTPILLIPFFQTGTRTKKNNVFAQAAIQYCKSINHVPNLNQPATWFCCWGPAP